MTSITWKLEGDLQNRLERSYRRMHSKWYTADKVFVADGNNWPGDWEGRTILALTTLGRSLNRQPLELEKMISNLFTHLNERGYLGPVREEQTFDEQQISGHSWLLRGLIDYYEWKKDIKVLSIIEAICHRLLMPTLGFYKHYPMNPKERIVSGEAAGNLTGKKIGYWLTSSDTGCAFIMLDGITKAYELLKDNSLEILIEEMIEAYFTMNLVELSVQTHATLSALRGIIRYGRLKGDRQLIEKCEDTYAIYLAHGRTENYANYNWFGRPTWTEPCAVVDAFMISMELAKITGKAVYIEEANYIYYNALSYAQRENGGFGCDICSGAAGDFIMPHQGIFEAHWCCTMRGANGLGYIAENSLHVKETSIKYHMYFEGLCEVIQDSGKLKLRNQGDFMREGTYRVCVEENTFAEPIKMMFYKPMWANHFAVRFHGREYTETKGGYIGVEIGAGEKGTLYLEMVISCRNERTINSGSVTGYFRKLHGYMLLAQEEGKDELKPLMDYVESKTDDDRYIPKRILFAKEG